MSFKIASLNPKSTQNSPNLPTLFSLMDFWCPNLKPSFPKILEKIPSKRLKRNHLIGIKSGQEKARSWGRPIAVGMSPTGCHQSLATCFCRWSLAVVPPTARHPLLCFLLLLTLQSFSRYLLNCTHSSVTSKNIGFSFVIMSILRFKI